MPPAVSSRLSKLCLNRRNTANCRAATFISRKLLKTFKTDGLISGLEIYKKVKGRSLLFVRIQCARNMMVKTELMLKKQRWIIPTLTPISKSGTLTSNNVPVIIRIISLTLRCLRTKGGRKSSQNHGGEHQAPSTARRAALRCAVHCARARACMRICVSFSARGGGGGGGGGGIGAACGRCVLSTGYPSVPLDGRRAPPWRG
jgi:uncharacterized membrane protein YgcG